MSKVLKTNTTIAVPTAILQEYYELHGEGRLSSHVTEKLEELIGKQKAEQIHMEQYIELSKGTKDAVSGLLAELQAKNKYLGVSCVDLYKDILSKDLTPIRELARNDIEIYGALYRYEKEVKKENDRS